MQLLASCSLAKSKEFSGKLVLPNEDKKTPDKVLLNIVVDDGNTRVFQELDGKEFVTFKDIPTTFCPSSFEGRVFNEYSLEDLTQNKVKPVNGVVSLISLPKGYSDMLKLKKLSDMYPGIRFIGGKLLGVEGVNIGRLDLGKEKMSPVFEDIYDTFVEVDLDDLSGLQEIVKKTRKRAEGVGKTKTSKKSRKAGSGEKKEKKIPKRVEAFNKLFSEEEVAF